ncbi:MAG: segregation and condensation protein A, partial [Minisyncoccia bacterium]
MNAYQLKILNFEGPIEKLLELIEEKKLEINQVSLAEVTFDFLKYIEKLNEQIQGEENKKEYLTILSDFIVVASRLIFIKSKSLLNLENEEEEREIKDLETRLKWFGEFRPALKLIKNLWLKNYIFSHPYLWNKKMQANVFFPGNLNDVNLLTKALSDIFSDVETILKEEQKLEKTIISLEEKMKNILKFFELIQETNFEDLTKNADKSELIITFLAILHLARERLILLEQK